MSLAPDAVEPVDGDASRLDTSRHVRLITVLVVLMAAVSLDRVAGGLWVPRPTPRTTVWTDALFFAQQGAAYLCAGVLVDVFGLKRVVGLALIGWCGLIMLSGAAAGSSGLGGVYLLVALVFGVIHVAPHTAVRHGARSGENALALTIPLLASYLWLAAIPSLRSFIFVTRPLHADLPAWRMWFALVCATGASFITLVWLTQYRGRDEPEQRERRSAFDDASLLLADRRVWALAVLWALGTISAAIGEYRLLPFLETERGLSAGTTGWVVFCPYVAATAGAIGAAAWSDRLFLQTGSLTRARRPFAVAGFAFSAALGLVPLVRQDDLVAMSCVAAAGIGMQCIVDVIVLDIAPRRSIGTLVGFLSACGSSLHFLLLELARALYQWAHSLAPILAVGSIVGIVGAVAAHRLLQRIEPIRDPAESRDIPAVFT